MKSIKNLIPHKRLEYIHYVIFNQKKYIREEIIMPQSFRWESTPDKLENLHTIFWKSFDKNDDTIEYFSDDMGWAKNGKLDKLNPIPEIEKIFKDLIGKDLIYF